MIEVDVGGTIYEFPDGTPPEVMKAALRRKTSQYQYDGSEYGKPTDGMTTGDKVLAGIGQGMHSVGQGLGQLVGLTNSNDIAQSRKTDAALLDTGAGQVGSVIGNVAAALPTAFIPGANTVTGAALIGAGTGALYTPGDLSDRAGAALGGAIGGAAGQAIPKAYGIARAAAEPLTRKGRTRILSRLLQSGVGANSDDVANRLTAASPLVPGSEPTAAEVAESGFISALQRSAKSADPEAYTMREMQQASARANALRGIAGDETKKAAAVAAREATAGPLYTAAKAVDVPVTPELSELFSRPAIRSAYRIAQKNAANRGQALPSLDDLMQGGTINGGTLHTLKMAVDAQIKGGAAKGIAGDSAAALNDARTALLGTIENAIPEYRLAREAYAAGSRPINQMEVGQALLNKMQGPLADHGALAKETGSTFARSLRNEGEQVARAATRFRQGLDDVMDPEQLDTLNAIAQDFARKANQQELGAAAGSNTFQNLAMDNLAAKAGMPPAVSGFLGSIPLLSGTSALVGGAAKAAGGALYKNADQAMRAQLAETLLNPQATAELLRAIPPAKLAQFANSLPPGIKQKLAQTLMTGMAGIPTAAGIGLANAPQ